MEPVCNECAQAAECREPVIMKARILRVNCCDLLVCDLCGCQEVLVHTNTPAASARASASASNTAAR